MCGKIFPSWGSHNKFHELSHQIRNEMQMFIKFRCDALDKSTELVVTSKYRTYGSDNRLTSSVQEPEFKG